jgi:hypothetical protein
MLQKTIERKKYYEDLGVENNVILEDLKVMKHSQIPNAYFVHAKYMIGSGGDYKDYEVLDSLDEKGEWIDMKKDLTKLEYGAFLKDCEVSNF